MQKQKFQQVPLDYIQNPQQIEDYDELDDQNAYKTEEVEQQNVVHDQKAEQMKNCLLSIRRNLLEFKELVDTLNQRTQIICKPIITNIKERANDDQAKAYLCKLRTLKTIKKSYGLSNFLQKTTEEEKMIEKSLQKISKEFSFCSSNQLRLYARAFKFNQEDNFIYANLYHDRLSNQAPYLLLIKKDWAQLKMDFFILQHEQYL
ncbi:unnamed protein product [Paramecium sonneborni]|uniref:Uncharacterized protein n=1 Tax=Paramecium sonneborni TaxID=65129 RepID=A0A8S1N9L8_9CILI|nr:unnamed protein product [Paramecium sonneborni]